jgi:hypothetical protein
VTGRQTTSIAERQQWLPRAASERLIHSFGQSTVHPLDDMRVRVEGDDYYAGVPEKLLYILGCLPATRSIVAQVCRRSWSLIAGSSALFKSGLKCLPRRFVQVIVVPVVVGNTRLLSRSAAVAPYPSGVSAAELLAEGYSEECMASEQRLRFVAAMRQQ